MTHPSGMEIRAAMPRRKWFNIPTEIRKQYPDVPIYEFYNMVRSIYGVLSRDLKWGTVSKCTTGNEVFWCI